MKLNKEKIDVLRAEKMLTLTELSSMARVGVTTISQGCKRDINPTTVGRLAKALDVDVTDIILREGD